MNAPPPSYFEVDSGSEDTGYSPLSADHSVTTDHTHLMSGPGIDNSLLAHHPAHFPPSGNCSYQPGGYGTTDYQPLTLAQHDVPADQGYASYAKHFHKSVMMTQPKSHTVMVHSVPDRMTMALMTTVCCCWPLGLVAVLRAQESRRALQQGDMISASIFSMESRRFSLWAIAGGVFCLVVSVIVIIVIVRLNYDTYDQ